MILPRAARLVACGLLFSLGASVATATTFEERIADIYRRNDAENARISAEAKQKLAASSAQPEALQAAPSTSSPTTAAATPAPLSDDILFQYGRVGHFVDGLARVTIGDQRGFIDPTGREVIPPQFTEAEDFRDGLAMASRGNRWGVIDPQGNFVIEPEHAKADIGHVGGGLVRIKRDGAWALFDRRGQALTPFHFNDVHAELSAGRLGVARDGTWGFVDERAELVIAPNYTEAAPFNEGLARIRNKERRYGFIDPSGREVIPAIYPSVGDFSEGLVALMDPDPEKPSNQKMIGFADRTGALVIPFEYKSLELFAGVGPLRIAFSDGLVPVRMKDGRHAYLNRAGEAAIIGDYDLMLPFFDGRANVGRTNRNQSSAMSMSFAYHEGFIDRSGKPMGSLEYDSVGGFSHGLAAVNRGRNLFVTVDQGDENTKSLRRLQLSLLNPGKWGYVNRDGEEAIALQFTDARHFSQGFAAVNLGATVEANETSDRGHVTGGKWGLIDTTGEIVVPIQFDSIGNVDRDGNVRIVQARRARVLNVLGLTAMQKGLAAMQAQNPTEALRQFTVAARDGNATAVGNLGTMNLRGMGVPPNPTVGLKWLNWAARRGDAQSMFNLGLFHAETNQRDQSREWLQKAQTAGHPQAQAALAQLERMGAPAPSQPTAPAPQRERERTR